MLVSSVFLTAFAQEAQAEDSIVTEYEYLEDGSYFVITIHQGAQTRGTTSGEKTAAYYNSSNVKIWSVTVHGAFTYTGYSSTTTSASGYVDVFVNGASLVSSQSYTSGDTAVAKATVAYAGVNRPLTVTLTCDRNGILS